MQAEREFNGISVNVPSLKWIMYIGPFNNFYLTISCDILSILCKRQNFEISPTIFGELWVLLSYGVRKSFSYIVQKDVIYPKRFEERFKILSIIYLWCDFCTKNKQDSEHWIILTHAKVEWNAVKCLIWVKSSIIFYNFHSTLAEHHDKK